MADIFSKSKRSLIMASIAGQDTRSEILVRSKLFRLGFRFRKNVKTLPGKPDIVLPKYKTIVLIHGCFWHGHDCKKASMPTSNIEFWNFKIQTNCERDKRVKKELKKIGWRVIIIWDCELKNKNSIDMTVKKLIHKLTSRTM